MRFFLLQFVLNFPDFLFLDDILLMQFSDLLLLLVDGFNLLLGLLGELLEFFLHSRNFIGCLAIFIALERLLLGLSDFLQGFLFFLQGFELTFEVFELVLLLNNLIDVVLTVQISPQLGDLCLVLLDLQLLLLQFLLQLHNPFVLLDLGGRLLFLLALLLLVGDFVHFSCQFLELSLELDVLLDELVFAEQGITYAPFSAMIVIFQLQARPMISLFTEQVDLLKKKPQLLAKTTYKLMQASANAHHPHNKLIPSSDAQQLLSILTQYPLTSNNTDALHHLLAANCLSMTLRVNFHQLSENRLYAAVVMHYGQIIEDVGVRLIIPQEEAFTYTKLIARGVVVSRIILKLVERTHNFVPEFYRFARQAVNVLQELLTLPDLNQEPLTEKENPQHLILRMCLSKKVTRRILIHALNCIHQQILQNIVSCPSSKELQIIKEIKEKFEQIHASLPEESREHLNSFVEKEQQADGNVYLEEPIAVKELTPRIYDEEKAAVLSKLRRKKQKLTKKIQNDMKKSVSLKQQQNHAREEVRRERSKRQYKKELFVVEKQTAEAKKYHRKEQKVKLIKKTMNTKGNTQKSRLDKLSAKKKKK